MCRDGALEIALRQHGYCLRSVDHFYFLNTFSCVAPDKHHVNSSIEFYLFDIFANHQIDSAYLMAAG